MGTGYQNFLWGIFKWYCYFIEEKKPMLPQYHLASNPALCHHSTLMPLSLIWIIMHPVACLNINHLPNVQWPKNVTCTKGIADRLAIKAFGMVHWNIQDDQRCLHHIAIPDAAWDPDLLHALLSPQHLSQQANFPCPHGMYMQQLSNECKRFWQQWQFIKTIPLDPKYNTPWFFSSSGMTKFWLLDKNFNKNSNNN